MTENIKDTARSGFTTNAWYEKQMEGALALLGTTKLDVAAYGTAHLTEDSDGPKFLWLEMRNGKKYWFLNFQELVQVVEVTTDEQLRQQEGALQAMVMLFG